MKLVVGRKIWPPSRSRGMLPDHHTPATWALPGLYVVGGWVVVFVLLVLLSRPALGDGPEIAAADAQPAFEQVERWVRAGAVPVDRLKAPMTGVFGVQVILRDEGELIGRGSALRQDVADAIDQLGPEVDLNGLLAIATRSALEDAQDKLKRRAINLDLGRPELFELLLQEFYSRALVDVQIGYGLTSVLLPPAAADDAIFGQFAPGYHGLRMTGPLAPEADLLWPSAILARNTSPRSQLRQLLDRQGYNIEDLPLIARQGGPQLQRFQVYHIVRASQFQPARPLVRGNLALNQPLIDSRTLDGLVERIARHLEQKTLPAPQRDERLVRGPYHPSYNKVDPELAEPRQVALMCYAMMLHCERQFARDPNNEKNRQRAELVAQVIRRYADTALPGLEQNNHLTTAFMLMALNHGPVTVDIALRDDLAKAVLAMRHPEGGFRAVAGQDTRLSRATAAVLTAALAGQAIESNNPAYARAAWLGLAELFRVNQDDPKLVDLVWVSTALGRAGDRLAAASDDPDAVAKLAGYRAFLSEQTELLIDQQIKAAPLLGPDDVVGGFLLSPAPAGSPPNPTWQSAMPLAIVALSLQDPGIIEPDRVHGPILALGLGARFINQLLLTRTNGYYLRDLAMADGGVRNTLWDNTLYLDCSSMSLIALTQFQSALDELNRRDRASDE